MRIAFTFGPLAALLFASTSHTEINKVCAIKAEGAPISGRTGIGNYRDGAQWTKTKLAALP